MTLFHDKQNNKRNEEVGGFTKRGHDNNWLYSTNTVDVLRSYMEKCPELFDYLSVSERVSGDHFHHGDIFPEGDGEDRLKELSDWIKELPCSTIGRQPCGTKTLDEMTVKSIEEEVAVLENERHRKKLVTMQVKPHLLYKTNLSKGANVPDPDTTFELFDRVVNVREGFSVPLGLRGTIIGLQKNDKPENAMIEVLFDAEFQGGLTIRCSAARAYRVPGSALINISHGERVARPATTSNNTGASATSGSQRGSKPTAVVTPMDLQAANRPQEWQMPKQSDSYSKIAGGGRRGSGPPPRRSSQEKEQSPSVKHIAPPDPKNLPLPTAFLKKSGAEKSGGKKQNSPPPPPPSASNGRGRGGSASQSQGRGRGRGAAGNQKQPPPPPPGGAQAGEAAGGSFDLQSLWASLQQPQPQQAPVPVHVPVQQAQQTAAQMDPNVQQFFAAHQHLAASTGPPPVRPFVQPQQPPLPPVMQVLGFPPSSAPMEQQIFPNQAQPPHRPPQQAAQKPRAPTNSMMDFVPLQVTMKQNLQHKNPLNKSKSKPSAESRKPEGPGSKFDRSIKERDQATPEKSDQSAVSQASSSQNSAPKSGPKKQKSGRLAANFGGGGTGN